MSLCKFLTDGSFFFVCTGGCVLLNGAGRFRSTANTAEDTRPEWLKAITTAIQKFVIGLSFIYTKQPARVEQILKQVYIDPSNVDSELVESIIHPSQDDNAAEVYYRIVSRNGNGPMVFVDE